MFTLADLTEITGAKRRSVQLWAEAGALQAAPQTDRAGTGVHRSFDRDEAIVASILHAFAEQGVPIGKLLGVSKALRHSLKTEQHRFYEWAIKGEGRNILFFDQRDLFFWSSADANPKNPKHLEDVIPLLMGAGSFSGVYVNLNACLAGMKQAAT